ncbi:MAG TPA: hypothetical protein VK031_06090, partial [Tissierellaceae bacterium]|nr:hypothetical protein [Tissierellaceae bacterium]
MTYKINRVQGQSFPGRGEKPSKTKLNKSLSFQNYLYKEIKKKDIKISAHARERLKERQLDFQAKDMDRIKEAI